MRNTAKSRRAYAFTHGRIALLLALGASLHTQALAQTADTDFETALRRAPSPAAPVSRTPPGVAGASDLPPAGLLPAKWRAPLMIRRDLDAAERAAGKGEIDPVAWIEHHIGPIPLPPGARAMRCETFGLRATFTLGIEASGEFRRVIDENVALPPPTPGKTRKAELAGMSMAQIGADPQYRLIALHGQADKIPATAAKLRDVRAFLRTRGFLPYDASPAAETWRHADAGPGKPTMDITLMPSPAFAAVTCGRRGITMPSGPMLYVAPSYPDPDWKDRVRG